MKLFKFKRIILSAFVLFFCSGIRAEKYDLITNWKYRVSAPAGLPTETCNPLPFPDSKHPNSIIVGLGYGVVRLDAEGKELFKFQVSGNVMVPAVGDVNGDGNSEIVIPTSSGLIYCIDQHGKLLWKTDLKDNLYSFSGAVLADIDGDGKLESFFNARAGTVYCLNADGSLRWKVLAEPRACNPAVGDIDGDGKAEIFFGTDLGKIFCLDYRGRYLWHTEIPNGVYGRSSPILVDLNGDGRYELVMPHSNTTPYPAIVVLDAHSGKLLWKGKTIMQNYGGTSIADLDHDGKKEVIELDKGNTVNVFDCDGHLKWRTTLSGHGMFFAAGIADFFNDGHDELLCGCRQTGPDGQTMFLLDDHGKVIREYKEGSDRQTSPVIADLNGDHIPEIYTTDVARKYIVSYSLEGSKPGGRIPWPCWKRDPDNSGFLKSSVKKKFPIETPKPEELHESETMAAFIGRNSLNIPLPSSYSGKEVFCETRLTDNHHVTSSKFTWADNKNNQVKITFSLPSAEEQNLEYIVRDRESKEVLVRKSVKVTAAGYQKDKDYLAKSAAEMNQIEKQLPPSDFSLVSDLSARITQMSTLLAEIKNIKDAAVLSAANKTVESNRQKMDFCLKYERFLDRIRKNGIKGNFFAWQDPNPWNEAKPEDVYPADPTPDTTKIPVLAMGNETEAVVLDITNLMESSQVVKIYPYDLTDENGKKISYRNVVELREAINTPNARGTMVDEVLPLLNEGNTLYLGPTDTRKLWVNLNTRTLAPGHYTARLGIESESLTESVQTADINLDVSTVRVPDKNEFAFNTWSSIEIKDDVMRAKVVKDLIAHKIGVLSMLPGPRFYLDDNGKLHADWSHWDKYYTPLKDKIVCYVTSALSVETNGRKVSKDQYASLLKEAYSMAEKGMAARGIDKKQWAIYVMDEPALTGYPSIEEAVRIAKKIRAASPDVQLYIDPAGMVTPETMKPFEGLIDIYSPQIDLLKNPDGKLLKYFHSLNKRLWFYEAPEPARTFHPLGHYRVQAWLAFDYGLTGCGFWCYNQNNKNNSWRKDVPGDYDVIYNDGNNIIPSRRWEACRDGVEDYYLLMMLKRKIAEFKTGSEQQKEIAQEAEINMYRIVHGITANVKKIQEISRDFIPYEVDYSLFTEGRKTLIGYLEKMNEMNN